MSFDFRPAAQPERFGQIQADVFGLPALILDPFFDDCFIAHNFHPRFEAIERHAGESLAVQFAQLILIIMVVRRAENHATHPALGDESVSAFWRIDLGAFRLIKSSEMLVQDIADRFFLRKPERLIERANKKRLQGLAVGADVVELADVRSRGAGQGIEDGAENRCRKHTEAGANYGIPVSEGRLATTPDEARAAAEELGGAVVVKAQVLTGGRGKAGGVKLADDAVDAEAKARDILGLDINGHVVRRLWIERASDIAKEYYLSITFDRGARAPLYMLTTEGGVEIEQVAEEQPEALARLHADPLEGFQPYQARRLIYGAGIDDPGEQKQILAIIEKLYACFLESDAMLTEINPLIVTPDGEVRALDSKFTVDDSALYRHPEIAEMRDVAAADPQEQLAREKGVTYVKLDGDVGILGNGAGLSMSTVDVVVVAGGRPANFCDLGGGGDAQGVVDALEVITSDEQVRSVFFNIFGGITRCDEVARGILAALEQMKIELPIVVRLDGTNADEGRRILAEAAPPNLHVEPTMLEAAKRAVELAA